ncbi:TPA: tape measure protein [Enterococcus faecalis]|uniref:tape measure protein n=1 Tax=Enterococcus faecalis TaxID=1351 RepID=UPI00226F5DAC|nr:tape measure protein [Enterococcus faecalis]HAP3886155.1 tape measure protein [Enterococcus faecalis]HAP3922304.1 tape measure protein [Enterococcus faecalis]HAP3934617.1 tape measure protein [Enterococcus faecalis]HAP3938433.1 tape measure protein [Enterococcus faecalis]
MAQSKTVKATLSAVDKGFTRTMNSAVSSLKRFSAGTSGLSGQVSKVKSSFGSIASAIGIYKAASLAATTVTNSFTGAISRYDTMNNFPKVMKQLGFSAEESTQAVNDLSKGVQGLPTPLNEVVSTAQRLTVLTGNLGKSTKLTIALNDAFLASGSSSADASRGLQQFTQMLAVGKVDMMAWRTLQETMPIALTKTANAFGFAGQSAQTDFYNALKEGTITFDQFADKLIELDGGASGFAAMARSATDGVAMAMSNAKTAVVRGVTRSIEAFDKFNKAVGGMTVAELITAAGATIEGVLKKAATSFENFASIAKPYIDVVKNAFTKVAPVVKSALSSVVGELTNSSKNFLESSSTVDKFKSIVNQVSSAIIRFSTYIQENASKIADYAKKAIKLWAAFKGYTILKGATGEIVNFSRTVSGSLATVFDASTKIDSRWRKFVLNPLLRAITSGGTTVKARMLVFSDSFKGSMKSLSSQTEFGAVRRGFTSIKSAISETFPTFSKFASSVRHPIRSLASFSLSAKGTGTAVNGATLLIGNGFKTMSLTAVKAIGKLTLTLLSNPITAILVAITTTVVGAIQAWKSNFMNVQGFAKSAFSGIGQSIKSVIPHFNNVTKTVKSFGNILKWLGTGAIVGVTFAIAGFVDGLRAIVTVGKTVVNAIMAISNGVKGLWKRLKGDSKGADKAFKDMKKSLSDIEKDWDTMFSDSALKKAAKSTEELGKKSKDTTKAISLNMKEASSSVENYSSKLDEAKQAMTELFSQQNGSTAGVETYFKNTLDLVTNLKEQQKKAVETYNKQIEAAEGKSEAEKQKIFANASSQYMKAVQTNNSDLLKVYTDYSNQLKNNKTVEGQELTEQQRATLQNQTNIIRDQLLQQNQQFVEAGMNKLANKQALSEQEKEQTLTSLRTLGEIQAQQVQENNAQIQQLETQKNQAKTESEKAAFQNQITQLQTQNSQIRQSELEQGAQLLAIISQNGANKIAVTADNLAQLKGVTDQQLLGIYQSYVNNGASIDQQMALLAGMLRQRGIDGSNGLVQGLQSNDPTKWANMSRADIVNTLQALPPDLFRNGQDGKNQLIDGLNSGKTQLNNVGKELMSSMNSGQSSQKSNSKKAAADNSSAAASGTRSKSNEHKNAGKSNAQQTNAGINSEKGNAKNSGSQLGAATIQGYLTQLPSANNAGRSLGNAVSQGAGSVDMSPVGSNMAKGVASGIRASQGEAVAAMQNLVAAVNAEAQKKAKIKSPSRLLKYDVGVFLAQGVAAGIREDTSVAVQSAKDMISSIHQSITGSRLMKRSNAIEVKHSIDNTPMGKMVEILEEIRHLTVVMDTGQVVGALGSPMNLNLAEQQKQDGRYRS